MPGQAVYPRPLQLSRWFVGGDKPRPYEIKKKIEQQDGT
jgi:hypothetical protein